MRRYIETRIHLRNLRCRLRDKTAENLHLREQLFGSPRLGLRRPAWLLEFDLAEALRQGAKCRELTQERDNAVAALARLREQIAALCEKYTKRADNLQQELDLDDAAGLDDDDDQGEDLVKAMRAVRDDLQQVVDAVTDGDNALSFKGLSAALLRIIEQAQGAATS